MTLKLGGKDVTGVYLGGQAASAVYLGDQKIWSSFVPLPLEYKNFAENTSGHSNETASASLNTDDADFTLGFMALGETSRGTPSGTLSKYKDEDFVYGSLNVIYDTGRGSHNGFVKDFTMVNPPSGTGTVTLSVSNASSSALALLTFSGYGSLTGPRSHSGLSGTPKTWSGSLASDGMDAEPGDIGIAVIYRLSSKVQGHVQFQGLNLSTSNNATAVADRVVSQSWNTSSGNRLGFMIYVITDFSKTTKFGMQGAVSETDPYVIAVYRMQPVKA